MSSFFIILLSLVLYQKIATVLDDYRHPPQGKLFDMGGYKLHLNSSGEGDITVVCDAGLSGTSLGWTFVQDEVSKFARICSYDRAGYGWSDRSPLERTSENIAKELFALLKKAEIPGPYLLVGHSFGGANVLQFADLYPKDTLGVILVDSVQEEMQFTQDHPKLQWFLAFIGYKRLKGPSGEIKAMFSPFPKQHQDAYIAQMNKTLYTETVNREMDALNKSLNQMEKVFLQKPLIVITAGTSTEEWKLFQEKLLLKSNQSKQIFAENSDHMINHHQPKVIVDAIYEIIGAL